MRASLVHDALYQLIRNKEISGRSIEIHADRIFKQLCVMDGLSRWRASLYYFGLRKFGKKARNPKYKKAILVAP